MDHTVVDLLGVLELAIVAIFSIEYLLRILVSQDKKRFIFSMWGVIDLLAILPFYFFFLGLEFDLVMLRAFRLIRLTRLLKLARYNKAMARLGLAMKIAREDLLVSLGATCIMLFVASFGIYQFENSVQPEKFGSVFDSLWWALSTLTTVGYGDVYPMTLGGKVFTGLVLMIGLGIVALPAGIIASSLTEARERQKSIVDPLVRIPPN
jgi:voltage-gated potassium channel